MPGKGDGITKRGDGRFMGRAVVETPTGTKRKTIYGKTYDEVKKKLNKLRADADRGLEPILKTLQSYTNKHIAYP